MKQEKREGLLERSNISFGHMLKRTDYEEKLDSMIAVKKEYSI